MPSLPPVLVAGAGVFGLCAALGALEAGAAVTIFDPEEGLKSASSVAAGMIAPFGEILLDDYEIELWPLFRSCRDLWLDLAAQVPDLEVRRPGTLFRLPPETAATAGPRLAALKALGAAAEGRPSAPWLEIDTAEDWLIDPPAALSALRTAARRLGARFERTRLSRRDVGDDVLLVAAAGAEARALGLDPLIPPLEPIKGHVLRFPEERGLGPVVRSEGLYLAPQSSGLIAGATMEPGRRDLDLDPSRVEALRSAAVAMRPALEGAPFHAAVGVRAGTVDRLPVIGPVDGGAVFLALGARRNGWLLGPLVGRMVRAYLTDQSFDPAWRRFDPARAL